MSPLLLNLVKESIADTDNSGYEVDERCVEHSVAPVPGNYFVLDSVPSCAVPATRGQVSTVVSWTPGCNG